MAETIIIPAKNVWEYFHTHLEDLASLMHVIAENKDYGVCIYVTSYNGLASIVVYADDTLVYEELVVNENDCSKTVEKIYNKYLTATFVNEYAKEEMDITAEHDITEEDTELTQVDEDDLISEREEELDNAVFDFIMTVLEGYVDPESCDFDSLCEDLKDHFLEYMARKHDLPIRRPMYLEYEDGSVEFEEFPYEHLEFEDEYNPIYKK